MNLRIGVLAISDRASQGVMDDRGGPAVAEAVAHPEWQVLKMEVIPDEQSLIEATLRSWSDDGAIDVILTTGGTGLGPRDVTPEATAAVADRTIPGIADTIRAAGLVQTPMAMISRGLAVVRGATLIINLPGSPRGAAESVAIVKPILEHAIATLHGGKH
jgi:molybdopterin adenylyltransferase